MFFSYGEKKYRGKITCFFAYEVPCEKAGLPIEYRWVTRALESREETTKNEKAAKVATSHAAEGLKSWLTWGFGELRKELGELRKELGELRKELGELGELMKELRD